MGPDQDAYRPLTPGMRRMLHAAAALVFGVGIPLLVLTEYTDALFAWTVQPPLTAAAMGGCYWSAGVLELMAARERHWARARVAVPGVLLFTLLTCVPTALNFRHFNLRNPAAYAWIAVYLAVPVILAWLWRRQAGAPGPDEPRTAPMPALIRAAYACLGAVMIGYGLVMFLAPALVGSGWPWELNPADSRYASLARMEPYMGVWLLGLGAVAGHSALEGDLRRIRCVMGGGTALPLLLAMALARYPQAVRWDRPATWAFVACLAFLLSISLWGLARLRRLDRPAVGS